MSIPQRVRIANRRRGGLWWRIPSALLCWLLFAAPLAAAGGALAVLRSWAADLPRVPDLERWEERAPRTSTLLAADGTVLAEIPFQDGPRVGHRFPVAYREIPPVLIQALLAAEDVRFFSHRGVDPKAVVRAAWANYRAGRIVEGASTITQQVARSLLPKAIGDERTLRRKVREALLARRIERAYPKERILEVYANHVFLGAGAYGVAAAARAYFDTSPGELSLAQAALIAGLAQAPGRADPYLDREAARARRDQVLARMWRAGFVSAQAYREAAATPIELERPPVRYGSLAPWLTERARLEVESSWPEAYRRGGLVIETPAQAVLSLEAGKEARAHLEGVGESGQEPPQVGAVLWDHRTGYVEAIVGGRDWTESRFDRATQACRQPGSAFKPLVYAAALEENAITPGTPLRDAPIAEYDERLDVHWKPQNSGRAFRGVALAQDALAASLNAPAVDVLDRAGPRAVLDLARRLGISTEIDDVRPMALGASCVIPIELAGAFAAFARRGRAAEPIFAVRVRRGDRVVLDRASPFDPTLAPPRRLDRMAAEAAGDGEGDRVLDEPTAFLVSDMLRDVVLRGTGSGARRIGRPAAGKTGTTNDNTDAWFVGYTGRLVAAVWIGHDDPSRSLGRGRDGSRAALPLWNRLVVRAEGERDEVPVPGEPPPGVLRARVDRETGLLAQPGAGGAAELFFKAGTAPTERAGGAAGVPRSLDRVTREF